jgi:NAD(P)H-dependent FMN reductase
LIAAAEDRGDHGDLVARITIRTEVKMSAIARPDASSQDVAHPARPQAPRVLLASFSPRSTSRSREGAVVAAEMLRAAGAEISLLDQRHTPLVAAGLEDSSYPPTIQNAVDLANRVDALVIAAPVHRATVSGVTRNAIELLRGGIEGKPVLPVLAAGSPRAHLAAQSLRADLFLNFRAVPLPAILITPELDDSELRNRLNRGILSMLNGLGTR